MAARKKIRQKKGFRISDYVVYPAHGVGKVVDIETQEISGYSLELFVVHFEQDKMTLRVPTSKVNDVCMRKISTRAGMEKATETLRGRPKIRRTMWSRRAQEYEAKINSGDLISVAEVVRDLYRADDQPERSYSERQLYEAALERMSRETAAVYKLDEEGGRRHIETVLEEAAQSIHNKKDGSDTPVEESEKKGQEAA
jgi:CarD family transcriptional regulator